MRILWFLAVFNANGSFLRISTLLIENYEVNFDFWKNISATKLSLNIVFFRFPSFFSNKNTLTHFFMLRHLGKMDTLQKFRPSYFNFIFVASWFFNIIFSNFFAEMLDQFDILIICVKTKNWAFGQSKHFGWAIRWLWGFMKKHRFFL